MCVSGPIAHGNFHVPTNYRAIVDRIPELNRTSAITVRNAFRAPITWRSIAKCMNAKWPQWNWTQCGPVCHQADQADDPKYSSINSNFQWTNFRDTNETIYIACSIFGGLKLEHQVKLECKQTKKNEWNENKTHNFYNCSRTKRVFSVKFTYLSTFRTSIASIATICFLVSHVARLDWIWQQSRARAWYWSTNSVLYTM